MNKIEKITKEVFKSRGCKFDTLESAIENDRKHIVADLAENCYENERTGTTEIDCLINIFNILIDNNLTDKKSLINFKSKLMN